MKRTLKRKNKVTINDLRKICPLADSISIKSLFLAIAQKYKYFLTSDEAIRINKGNLKKAYGIRVISSVYEMDEEGKKQLYGCKDSTKPA